ncbi:MAG: biotin/lipoyl-binding protein, partial [Candidatus Zixiibacteriota bacterium]
MKFLSVKIIPVYAALIMPSLTGCAGDEVEMGGSGLLEADEAVVSAETGGRVLKLRFAEGTSVKSGETLLVIDPSHLELELQSAQAAREAAQARLKSARIQHEQAQESERYAIQERDRIATLLKSGTAAQRQFDELEHRVSTATLARRGAEANILAIEAELARLDADIDRLERRLQDCYPIAPITGIVTDKYVETGELLTPGRPMAKISRLDTL